MLFALGGRLTADGPPDGLGGNVFCGRGLPCTGGLTGISGPSFSIGLLGEADLPGKGGGVILGEAGLFSGNS